MSFKIGQKVVVSRANDNETYNSFKDSVLKITDKYNKGAYYDNSMYPMFLYEFKDEKGQSIPFALYEYELKKA